jgi:hypothetical protein
MGAVGASGVFVLYMKMSENIHYLSVVPNVPLARARTGSGFSFQTDKPVT